MKPPIKLRGYCPMGCGETLYLETGLNADFNTIGCRGPFCPRPTAAAEILADPQTEHIITIDSVIQGRYSMIHPLRERLEGGLLSCRLTRWLARNRGHWPARGTYQATTDHETWTFTPTTETTKPEPHPTPRSTT
jgi:hypothetical protein